MDGSDTRTMLRVSSHLICLAADVGDSKLVWVRFDEEISDLYSANYDFSSIKLLARVKEKVLSITVVEDKIYWTDGWKIGWIRKSNEFRGITAPQAIADFRGKFHFVSNIVAIHSSVQPDRRINKCATGLCSDICVFTENYFTCLGSHPIQFSSDG